MIRWFKAVWRGLVEPAWIGDARDRYLSRILNIILLLVLVWGLVFELRFQLGGQPSGAGDTLALATLVLLAFAYLLNRRGQLAAALVLTVGTFIVLTFASALLQDIHQDHNLSILYYLIIVLLISDLFLSMRGYLVTSAITLGGVFAIFLLNPNADTVLLFLLVFCILLGFSSYSRRSIERQRITLASEYARERFLRSLEQKRSAQLSLLEEVGRSINESLNEREILQRTLDAVVNKFGYAEAVISLLMENDLLEVAAISGTQDFGYRPGYRQKMGHGIIGHVAETRQAHLAGDVSADPYYFSSAQRTGSAAGVPILHKGALLGVIYVESATRDALHEEDVQGLQTLANQVSTALQNARLHARTQDHLQVMTALQSVSRVITSSLDLDHILNNVIQLLRDSFGYTYISIYLLKGNLLQLGAELGYPKDMLMPEIPLTSGVVGRTARLKETQFVRDVSKDPDFLRASYVVRSEIAVPLMKDDNVLGVLNVEAEYDALLDENDVDLLNALAGSIAIAIDNARLHAEVKRMAMTDVISGLANRRAFDSFLEAEMARASRYSQPISLIILDLDSFKEYNDRWGHPAGDVRLKEIADVLRAELREHDVAARYGGEEFGIILPNTTKSGALHLAERLRRAAEECAPEPSNNLPYISGYTLSLGVATFPEDAGSIEELLLAADNAELMAKRLGKNRVCAANTSDKIPSP